MSQERKQKATDIQKLDYLINISVIKDETIPLLERTEIQSELKILSDEFRNEELIAYLKALKKKYNGTLVKSEWIMKLLNYCELNYSKSIVEQTSDTSWPAYLDDEAMIKRFEASDSDKQIVIINEPINYNEIKNFMLSVIVKYNNVNKKKIYPFVIANNIKTTGKVITQLTQKTAYKLLAIPDDVLRTTFLGTKEHAKTQDYFEEYFYTYAYAVDSNEKEGGVEYTLLSREPMPLDYVKVKGMVIPISDNIVVGRKAALNSTTQLMLVTGFEKVITNIDDKSFSKITKEIDGDFDKLYKLYFGEFRHPPIFEKFLLAWLFSTKEPYREIGGYPSHFGWFGPAGSGKSKTMECVEQVFNERGVGESATYKSLIPSFGGNTRPEPGLFCRAIRFLCIEEFLKFLMKSKFDDGDVALLNTLLEHKNKIVASGKFEGASVLARPTATMFFVTNFLPYKITNFNKLPEFIEPSFLSRFILYNQTKYHTDYINQRKKDSILNLDSDQVSDNPFPKPTKEAIQLYDYFKTKRIRVNGQPINEIFDEMRLSIADDPGLKEAYDARGVKHILYLLDGVTKLNHLLQKKEGEFVASRDDLEQTREIWKYIVFSWNENFSKLTMKEKEKYLTKDQSVVYNYICENEGQTVQEIEYGLKQPVLGAIRFLNDNGLIIQSAIGNRYSYYSYRYMNAKEEQYVSNRQ